jgi:hypothetical protein
MANRYWVGNGGNWSDNTNHWSASSGGAPGASTPTSSDNVYFDANSFSSGGQTVTLDATASCLDMDWTGATNTPAVAHNNLCLIYGSATFISAMSLSGTASMKFLSTSTGKTITTNGLTLVPLSIIFDGVGGEWTLQDNLTTDTGRSIQLDNGSLITGGHTITTKSFSSDNSNTRSVTLGASTLNLYGDLNFATVTNLTLDAGTSTIKMLGNNTSFKGGGETWYDAEFTHYNIALTGSNTFNTITLNRGSAQIFNVTSGTTQTVSSFVANGSSGNIITIKASSAGSAFTMNDAGGTNEVYYCSIKDSTVGGGATWDAYNSTDVSGNSGWNFLTSGSTATNMLLMGIG